MCGIFGIYNSDNAFYLTSLGLQSLQHRGQEGAGMVTVSNGKMYTHRKLGLVGEIFSEKISLPGNMSIGHVRYSTTGNKHNNSVDVQPFIIDCSVGNLAIAHNGNLINADALRDRLKGDGSIFSSTSDTEIILHMMANSNESDIVDALIASLRELKGSYSILLLSDKKLIAARDPRGYRPLVIGRLNDSYIICSETCSIDAINGEYVREVLPGEIIIIEDNLIKTIFPFKADVGKNCIFEHIYFSRPDSTVFGQSVYNMRMRMGKVLAEESHVDADVVIGVPDSGTHAAIGYARESGIPFLQGLIRSRYTGRTFIKPDQKSRESAVMLKHIPIKHAIENNRVIIVDDSIVRGTTLKRLVSLFRKYGAREVHVRIASPPVISPCYYGIDTPERDSLIAANYEVDEINNIIESDSLAYLSLDSLKKIQGDREGSYCESCFTGYYQ